MSPAETKHSFVCDCSTVAFYAPMAMIQWVLSVVYFFFEISESNYGSSILAVATGIALYPLLMRQLRPKRTAATESGVVLYPVLTAANIAIVLGLVDASVSPPVNDAFGAALTLSFICIVQVAIDSAILSFASR